MENRSWWRLRVRSEGWVGRCDSCEVFQRCLHHHLGRLSPGQLSQQRMPGARDVRIIAHAYGVGLFLALLCIAACSLADTCHAVPPSATFHPQCEYRCVPRRRPSAPDRCITNESYKCFDFLALWKSLEYHLMSRPVYCRNAHINIVEAQHKLLPPE